MPTPQPARDRLRSVRAEPDPDDGADPRIFFRKPGPRGKPSRKARQLCRQVFEALDGLLAADPGRPGEPASLGDLAIEAVVPAPDASRLLVTLTLRAGAPAGSLRGLLDQIDRAAPRFRAEVARAIRRRRAPHLAYRILPGPIPLQDTPTSG